jgi:hypothetical protein
MEPTSMEFSGALVRAAVRALREVGLSPAVLELAGPVEERRAEEALARATGLDAASQQRLREALVAVGDDVADVAKVRALGPDEEVPGAVSVGQNRYGVERLGGAAGAGGSGKARRGRGRKQPVKPMPPLVTIVRASEKGRAPALSEPHPQAAPAASPPAAPPRRVLPEGRGRFTSAGRLEGGGTPGAASWTRPPAEAPKDKSGAGRESPARPRGPGRGPRGGRGRR